MRSHVVYRVPKCVEVVHYPEARALVSHWESLCTPDAVPAIERGSDECRRLGAKTWIVDLTKNPGVPSQPDLEWMGTKGVELAKKNGLRAVINVHGESALASLGSKRWTKGASDGGLVTYDCKTLDDALALAADVAAGRAA
ncbi:MAG TPA: hypothetical protein VMR31_18875 [Myxococcota bacterium]|nr:hypothetical protein [Myxococcota bacterium]